GDRAARGKEWLGKDFFLASKKPVLWTHAVELDQPELPEAWFDEESMLGDFLRNLRETAPHTPAELELAQQIPAHHRVSALAGLGQWTEEEYRDVLHEAGLTGAQLLGAGERDS